MNINYIKCLSLNIIFINYNVKIFRFLKTRKNFKEYNHFINDHYPPDYDKFSISMIIR